MGVLTLAVKRETDKWAVHIVEGASTRQLGLVLPIMTVHDFESAGPGDEAFLLLHHHGHCVPGATLFFGFYAGRLCVREESYQGFARPFEQACAKKAWRCDLTARVGGHSRRQNEHGPSFSESWAADPDISLKVGLVP